MPPKKSKIDMNFYGSFGKFYAVISIGIAIATRFISFGQRY